jgi:5-formyltetrahydrofolate cyclo-ligase
MNSTVTKEEIRAAMRKQRLGLKADWVLTASARLAERVIVLPEFKRSSVVCCFLSLAGEVQTQAIMEAAWKTGKRIAVPCSRDDGEYMPAWFTPDEPLATGAFAVRQPATPHWAKPDGFGLVLVPGLAFSERGGRLGHGRGYYDRMLARLGRHVDSKAGLCFSCQVVPAVPMMEQDVAMDLVVTENAVFRTT